MNKETSRRSIPKSLRLKVYEKCGGHCAYCGCKLEFKELQVNHIKPLRVGGTNELDNYLPACRSCNHYKSTLDLEQFRSYLSTCSARLVRDCVAYNVAIRFGIIKHVSDEILFYFETESLKDQKEENMKNKEKYQKQIQDSFASSDPCEVKRKLIHGIKAGLCKMTCEECAKATKKWLEEEAE